MSPTWSRAAPTATSAPPTTSAPGATERARPSALDAMPFTYGGGLATAFLSLFSRGMSSEFFGGCLPENSGDRLSLCPLELLISLLNQEAERATTAVHSCALI